MIEGSGSGARAASITLTNGSRSRRAKTRGSGGSRSGSTSFGICLTWVFSFQCCYVEIWFLSWSCQFIIVMTSGTYGFGLPEFNHVNYTVRVSVYVKAVLRIRITLIRILIRLITVMRIQMRIWILILIWYGCGSRSDFSLDPNPDHAFYADPDRPKC